MAEAITSPDRVYQTDGVNELELSWFGLTGQQRLNEQKALLETRRKKHPFNRELGRELASVNASLMQLEALYRARLRVEVEGIKTPLGVVRYQADELAHDGLSLGCLDAGDVAAARSKWPDWEPGQLALSSEQRSEADHASRQQPEGEGEW